MLLTHTSPYSGSWYPRDETDLNGLLDRLFEQSLARTGTWLLPDPLGLVVPHAAPRYSGAVAAAAYRHVSAARPERIFLLGFSHRSDPDGVAIPDVASYSTPVGEVVVHVAASRELAGRSPFRLVDECTICDHSIEIQLPFLRRATPRASVIPLCVGRLTDSERAHAADGIAAAWRPGDLLLASSDLAHYGRDFDFEPFPADQHVSARLRAIDEKSIEAACAIDSAWFLRQTHGTGGMPCGRAPIALLLETLPRIGGPDVYQEELDYQTSGEIADDFSLSVSYAALGYFPRSSFELGESARAALLGSAAATLDRLRRGEREPVDAPDDSELGRRAGVFVSLRGQRGLIGCMGRMPGGAPLRQAVPDLALSAALDDPRNETPGRIPRDVEIEISLLTPMRLIRDAGQLRVGVDGARLEGNWFHSVLLPQAARAGWSVEDFVEALCRKAELPVAEPPAGSRLFRFQAQIFAARSARSTSAPV